MKVQIMRADVPNSNGIVYPLSALEECIQASKAETIFGMLDPGDITNVDFSKVSHIVDNLQIEDGYLVGDVQILQSAKGDLLKKLLEEVHIDFRASGTGVRVGNTITNFKLISIDAVYDGAEL
jgi:hypothetical protein